MAFCANILLKNRSCLGFNPYPPERGATPWNSWWGAGCRSLENHTRFQTKMGRVCTLFQTKTAQKTQPFGAAHPYMAYIREYPPPPRRPLPPQCHCVVSQDKKLLQASLSLLTINGYRENTAGVTMQWTAFPFSNALRYLSCRNRDKLCPDKPRWFVVRLSQLDWVNRFSHTLIQLSTNRECC